MALTFGFCFLDSLVRLVGFRVDDRFVSVARTGDTSEVVLVLVL